MPRCISHGVVAVVAVREVAAVVAVPVVVAVPEVAAETGVFPT